METVANLNETKTKIFQQFAENIADCRHKLMDQGDDFILKWLVAREFKLDVAEEMLRKSIEWRRINKIDTILDWYKPPEVLVKYYTAGAIGYDKSGGPVWIYSVGNLDVKGMFQSVSKKDYIWYCMIYLSERSRLHLRERNKKNGTDVTYMTFIGDMSNVSMRTMYYKPFLDAGMESTKILEANYPENLGRLFVINAPKMFTMLFAIVKSLLSQSTIDKFRIYGTDENEWKAALLEHIDADQLPVHYGGTMTDVNGDPKCSAVLNPGGTIPTSYYLSTAKLVPSEGMKSCTVLSSNKKRLKFKATEPNSHLRWKFFSESGDIAFYAYLKSDGEKVELYPKERIECHLIREEGSVPCEKMGTYVIEFDNTYSYFRTKKIWYDISIETVPTTINEEGEGSDDPDQTIPQR